MQEKRKLDIDPNKLPFMDFLSSRYSMTVRVNAGISYDYAKRNDISFFNLTVACILKTINEIPEFKRRIIDDEVYEYNHITSVSPIMQEDNSIREVEMEPVSEYESYAQWDRMYEDKKSDIDTYEFVVEPSLRDSKGICNLSCIPWIDFDSMTNIIASGNQIMPVVSWGKLVDGKIPVSLTASHIFVFGYHFKLFYEKLEYYLENPEVVCEK